MNLHRPSLSLLTILFLSGTVYATVPLPPQPYGVFQTLTRSDPRSSGDFGITVDSFDRRLIAGAINAKSEDGLDVGAAYIYEQNDSGNWLPVTELRPNDGQQNDAFGYGVAINGKNALVFSSRAIYFYRETSAETWDHVGRFAPQAGIEFGPHVDLDRSDAVVSGARPVRVGPGPSNWAGFIQIYRINGEGWREFQNISLGNQFVNAVAISDERIAVGITSAVQIYEKNDLGVYLRTTTIESPNKEANDWFGLSLSFDGNQLLIGDPTEDGHGVAYIYRKGADSNWDQWARLFPSDLSEASFGSDVALEGDVALVSSSTQQNDVVHVFEKDDDQWSHVSRLTSQFYNRGTALSTSNGIGFIGSGANVPGSIDVVSRVPEPTTALPMLIGLLSVAISRRVLSATKAAKPWCRVSGATGVSPALKCHNDKVADWLASSLKDKAVCCL